MSYVFCFLFCFILFGRWKYILSVRLNCKLTKLNLSNGAIAQRDTTALRMPGHWILKLIVSANEKILNNINIVARKLVK